MTEGERPRVYGLDARLDRLERELARLSSELAEVRALVRPEATPAPPPEASVVTPAPPPAPMPTPAPAPPPPSPPALQAPAPRPAPSGRPSPGAPPADERRPAAAQAPAKPPGRTFAELARDWDLTGARGFAIAGGIVMALGIALFLVLAANRGWIDERARVALGASASAAVFGAGLLLRARYGQYWTALAAVGAGLAGASATLAAAAARYDLVPDGLALPLAGLIAAAGTVVSIRWRSPGDRGDRAPRCRPRSRAPGRRHRDELGVGRLRGDRARGGWRRRSATRLARAPGLGLVRRRRSGRVAGCRAEPGPDRVGGGRGRLRAHAARNRRRTAARVEAGRRRPARAELCGRFLRPLPRPRDAGARRAGRPGDRAPRGRDGLGAPVRRTAPRAPARPGGRRRHVRAGARGGRHGRSPLRLVPDVGLGRTGGRAGRSRPPAGRRAAPGDGGGIRGARRSPCARDGCATHVPVRRGCRSPGGRASARIVWRGPPRRHATSCSG